MAGGLLAVGWARSPTPARHRSPSRPHPARSGPQPAPGRGHAGSPERHLAAATPGRCWGWIRIPLLGAPVEPRPAADQNPGRGPGQIHLVSDVMVASAGKEVDMGSQCAKCRASNTVQTCGECSYVFCCRCDADDIKKYPRGRSWTNGSNWCPRCGKTGKLKRTGKRGSW
jgi:hypothetical protein